MPSKKSKGKKGKDTKAKGPPKMSKKEKKLHAKYGMIKADGPSGKEDYVMGMRQDELEWTVEKLRGQVTVNRDERIRFQLERDFLHDIMMSYHKKYTCLKEEMEKKLAETNKMTEDQEDDVIIKSIEGKHFRYDSQMNCSTMDVRDEIRKKKIKEMLERAWQGIAQDLQDQEGILAQNAEKHRKKIIDTMNKLDDLDTYVEDHANQLKGFTNDLVKQMENSLKLFHLTRRMEFQMTEDRWSEFIWKLSRNFELQYEAMKNYYNDAAHSNLTLIFTLQDWMNDSLERMNMYQEKIIQYEKLMTDAHAKMPALRTDYLQNRVRHNFIVRTKAGTKTTLKDIGFLVNSINQNKTSFRQLSHKLTLIDNEREHYKTNCEGLIGEVVDACKFRFDVQREEDNSLGEVNRLIIEKGRLRSNFKTPESFTNFVTPHKIIYDHKDRLLESQRLKRIKIQKQAEDLRSSLEARILRVGLKKKHPTNTPDDGNIIGHIARLDWGPANLVSKGSYPLHEPPVVYRPCTPPDDENEIKLCLTDSIRGFLTWKDREKKTKALKELRESHFHPQHDHDLHHHLENRRQEK